MRVQVWLFATLLCFSLIAFGQDKISPPTRYIAGNDTFTVFTIQSERIIAFKINELSSCKKESMLANSIIDSCEMISASKDTIINLTKQQNKLLGQELVAKDEYISLLNKSESNLRKQLKKENVKKQAWKITTFAEAIISMYLIIIK